MAPQYCLTFLTDYGLEDGFVAACHGVAFQLAPNARFIDITHLISPGDIRRGAAILAQTVPYLARAVHVAVIDPGVGTGRRAIAVQAASGSVFVGPDNGLLSWAIAAEGGATAAVSLTRTALWRDENIPATFHGRDIFMPVAAHLAAGTPLTEAGEPVDPGGLVTLPEPLHRVTSEGAGRRTLETEVLTVDRFGNIQLAATSANAGRAGLAPGTAVTAAWDGGEVTVPFRRTFGDVPPGDLVACTDSAGYLSLTVNGGDAAARLSLRPPARVILRPQP